MTYEELIAKIKYNDTLYYTEELQPEISDAVYDELYLKLEALEKAQGWRHHDSPTLLVGGGIKGKVKHKYPLYSMRKVYDKEEIDAEFDVQTPKIDGTNLTLTYSKEGKLVLALTRGDGKFGQDVTHLVAGLNGIPKSFSTLLNWQDLIITGECVTDNEVENFRNYVSGALGLKRVEDFKERNIRFIAHDWLGDTLNYYDRMGYLGSKGFTTVLDKEVLTKYPHDGIVYRINSYKRCQELGYTSKYPRFAIALKERGVLTATTILQRVDWSVGRTGTVNPVGIIDPVMIDDAEISRVTLHNIEYIENEGLGLGDEIEIERAGGVIPKFIRVVAHSILGRQVTAEDAERAIGGGVKRSGPKLYVTDPEAHGTVKLLQHFIKTLQIKGLGPQSVAKMGLQHPVDLYESHNWKLLGANGAKIIDEIERSKTKPYNLVLAALGIEGVGRSMSEKIVQVIPRFDRLREVEYHNIPTVGPKTVEKILIWLDENESWATKLPLQLEQKDSVDDILSSDEKRKVCISGKVDMTKADLTEHLESKGFKVISSVTKDCYALITAGVPTSKYKKAEQYGIKIVDYWSNRTNILNGVI